MLKRLLVASMSLVCLWGTANADTSLDLLNDDSKGIKFKARHVSIGSAYEAQTSGDVFKKHLDSLNYRSAYNENYLKIAERYEGYLKEKSSKDDWAKYSPVLSMIYPDQSGRLVIANLQLEVPAFYQVVIFTHDVDKNKFSMRDRFIKKIMEQNCKRLESGIEIYSKEDWSEYMGFVSKLSNTITFKFSGGDNVTVLSNCPSINWSNYKSVM